MPCWVYCIYFSDALEDSAWHPKAYLKASGFLSESLQWYQNVMEDKPIFGAYEKGETSWACLLGLRLIFYWKPNDLPYLNLYLSSALTTAY